MSAPAKAGQVDSGIEARRPDRRRSTCKHLRVLRGDEAERARLGTAELSGPIAEATPRAAPARRGSPPSRSLADKGYDDTAGATMLIDRVLPKMVVEELSEEKSLAPADTSSQCRDVVKKAWNREAASI